MQFGTDPNVVGQVRWYRALPGAQFLGIPSKFGARTIWSRNEILGGPGEVRNPPRTWNDGTHETPANGQGGFCGPVTTWQNGFPGPTPPALPRNEFGVAMCCGGLLDPLGEPEIDVDIVSHPPWLLTQDGRPILTQTGEPIRAE